MGEIIYFGKVEKDQKRLTDIYARLDIIGANNAEARARLILNGLQFTPEMQSGPVSDLSGGWRMRVTLAGALLTGFLDFVFGAVCGACLWLFP